MIPFSPVSFLFQRWITCFFADTLGHWNGPACVHMFFAWSQQANTLFTFNSNFPCDVDE